MKINLGFKYFLGKFLQLLVTVTIVFYINRYISENSRNAKTYTYNKIILYAFFFHIALIVFDILTYESDYINKLVTYFMLCLLSLYVINWAIFKYMYKGFWLSFLISIAFTILFAGIFIIAFYYGIVSHGEKISDPVLMQFSYAKFVNNSLTQFMTFFLPLCGLIFWLTNFDNKIGNYLNQNLMGCLATISFVYVFYWYAIKIKLINSKQVLNSFITYLVLLYVLSVLQTYFLIDSIHNTCYGGEVQEAKTNNDMTELLTNLLIVSVIILLILNDIRKWSFFNYSSYLVITVFVFACLFSLSAKYPGITLVSLWNFIEWCILTSSNSHDTGNSFHFVMMNHKYNLKSRNKEGST